MASIFGFHVTFTEANIVVITCIYMGTIFRAAKLTEAGDITKPSRIPWSIQITFLTGFLCFVYIWADPYGTYLMYFFLISQGVLLTVSVLFGKKLALMEKDPSEAAEFKKVTMAFRLVFTYFFLLLGLVAVLAGVSAGLQKEPG